MRRKFGGTGSVFDLPLGVLAAVQFDRQFHRRTGEIGDPFADRMLPAEFPGRSAFAQRVP